MTKERINDEEKESRPLPDTIDTSGHDENVDDKALGSTRLFLVTCALSVSYFLILLNSTMVVTASHPSKTSCLLHSIAGSNQQAIPSITTKFNSTRDIGWYGSAYLLINCAMQPLAGKIYTSYPLKVCLISWKWEKLLITPAVHIPLVLGHL